VPDVLKAAAPRLPIWRPAVADPPLAHAELVNAEALLDLPHEAARVVAEQTAGRRQQEPGGTGPTLLRAVAEDQPAQFFDIRHIGVGNEADDRPLHGTADLDAGFHCQAAADRQRVDRRIVEQALEGQDAALDFEF
jgi:hypothetical protein